MLLLEFADEVLLEDQIEVLTTERSISVGSLDLENTT
jgi:hypothetical protein